MALSIGYITCTTFFDLLLVNLVITVIRNHQIVLDHLSFDARKSFAFYLFTDRIYACFTNES